MREEQHHVYVAQTSNNRVIAACELYFCLLPQCEALCTCSSGFPIATRLLAKTIGPWALLLETRLKSMSTEPLIVFLMFLVHKLWPKKQLWIKIAQKDFLTKILLFCLSFERETLESQQKAEKTQF